jgi:acyl transferase domain-containing protein
MTTQENTDDLDGAEIAVIGMALRVPGANNLEEFWANVRDGVESVTPLTEDELRAAGVAETEFQHPDYVAARARLHGVKNFDAAFFGFSPRDAALMDPQHRHFLEVSWEALEHAGCDPARFEGAIGVFGGSGHNAYMPYNLLTNPDLVDSVGFFLLRHTNNDKDFLVTRVAYLLDLHGPAINVQTACSTSLVGVHLGVQSLLNGESDMVLAGGVTIDMPLDRGYRYREGEILSKDGHCRSFDAASSGTIFGSGAGVVVLKRLDDALADCDTIHAVIRGTAVNNDGSNKVGFLAPSVDGQSAAIGEAIAVADVDPETIGFIECHGTGTEIGDPIEVAALTQAFRAHTDATQFCALGSVKSNIGHLDTAAGIAGFIKACLALKHKVIPPTVHFTTPNPRVDFEGSPFFVNGEVMNWETDGTPRRAGVSSLGVGGTNAHVILEEAPTAAPGSVSRPWQLLPISAKGPTALDDATTRLGDFLSTRPDQDLADVAHTLQSGRQPLDVRRFVVARDGADAAAVLLGEHPKRLQTGTAAVKRRSVVFMFPGQGGQYANMGRTLYDGETVFRACVDECAAILEPLMGLDLRSILFPDDAHIEMSNEQLAQSAITQPAIFTIEYAMAKLWMSWGIEPTALIGHSLGEYTAACIAEVFSLEDALTVVARRGQLMADLPGGSMMVVPQAAAVVEDYLEDGLSLAAINGPEFSVVSGPDAVVEALESRLTAADIAARRLHISMASHSSMMDPMLAPFTDVLAATKRSAPTIPYVSNLTGTWVTAEQVANPGYWASHVRNTVNFMGGLQTILAEDEERVLLEVGPGRSLATFARQIEGPHRKTISTSMRHATAVGDDLETALATMGELWTAGAIEDWTAFRGDECRSRVPIPTYPFQHQEFWVEPGENLAPSGARDVTKRPDLAEWFYVPGWSQTSPAASPTVRPDEVAPEWLVFVDEDGIGTHLAAALRTDARVTTVTQGNEFATAGDTFVIDPTDPTHYTRLIRELRDDDRSPTAIAYLWPLSNGDLPQPGEAEFDRAHTDAFYGQLFLAQAVASEADSEPIEWWVVSNDLFDVAGNGRVNPLQALALGPVRVIGQEYPHITCRSVDLGPIDGSDRQRAQVVDGLAKELRGKPDDEVIAHRGRNRWVQTHLAAPISESGESNDLLKDYGVYLITGGTGGIGLEIADHLATTAHARLVLLSRTALPARPERDQWLTDHRHSDPTSGTIRRIQAMEASGAEVEVIAADVTDATQMAAAVSTAVERFGGIDGVLHAAGHLSDQLIAMKDPSEAARVLAAKVTGTLVLEAALDGLDIDFMVLFSSVSAITGTAGQIDYAAANAFLDAYARYRNAIDDRATIAIGWGPWQQVGMTVRTAIDLGFMDDVKNAAATDHSLLDRRYETADQDVFEADMSATEQWLLDEHRTNTGLGLMPGTGYLDVVVASQDQRVEGQGVELSDVLFMAPFLVPDGDIATLRVSLPSEDGDFAISSSTTGPTHEHVRGQIRAIQGENPAPLDLDKIIARCQVRVEEFERFDNPQLRWGPRWNVLRRVAYGEEEALATLALPSEFADDLAEHRMHPAVLDLATGGALGLIPGFSAADDFFVPFSYGRLRLYQSFTAEVHSHIRIRPQQDTETATFDITVLDPSGTVLLEIESFVMRRASGEIITATGPSVVTAEPTEPLLESLANGITPDEGVRAFRRALSESLLPEITVVSQDLHALIQRSRNARHDDTGDSGTGTSHERPDVSTPFVAPSSERETAIAAIWEEMLGVEGVGVHDDFFELGGHSLLLTQAITRIKKLTTADVSLFVLFEAPTIGEQEAEIAKAEAEQGPADGAPTPTLGRVSRDKYRTQVGALQSRSGKG